jgi:ElaB/YqjD/DUF883 family membrane-anchored ribosome-binding protein
MFQKAGESTMADVVTTLKLKEDLAAVMRDAEVLINASAEQGGAKMAEARTQIRESLDAAKTRVRAAEHAVQKQASDAFHATEDYAKRSPWQAMGIAAGVGLVVGVLLGRR